MPRFFLGNFDFEHRLADPTRQLSAKLERINAELATSWLAVAHDGDYLWTPQPIEGSFFEQATRDGLPRVIPVVSFDDVPRGVECVPWGWTDDIRRLCDQRGWVRNDSPHEAVRAANSRQFSAALEREWNIGLDGASEATSQQQIDQLIAALGPHTRWLVKAEFGMSGRARIGGYREPTVAHRNWIAKRLDADGVVFFEPVVARQAEVGIQIDIPQGGQPQLIGVTPMLVDQRGQYAGSRFAIRDDRWRTSSMSKWSSAIDVALRAAQRLQELGYHGPLGIDAMLYCHDSVYERIRPLQDINARWTMGRLSLGFQRLLKAGESGCYLQGPHTLSEAVELSIPVRLVNSFGGFLALRAKRLTPQREKILNAIVASNELFDARVWASKFEQGEGGVRASRSTVCRTMELLEAAGLIRKITGADGHEVYEHDFDYSRAERRIIRTSPGAVGNAPVLNRKSFVCIEQ